MVKHFFKIALTNLERNQTFDVINVLCLALGHFFFHLRNSYFSFRRSAEIINTRKNTN